MTGTTLSQYRILEELGRGGMGIVYKAEDTKLERQVALKVLPAAALASEDDRARFYREAKAAAALNHPNIAAIHQIDEAIAVDADGNQMEASDGPRPFIAMEFIEGGTLEDRIKAGPLKLDEAVRIATQVADALKAAHAKDIVHRDIKSANIMLTTDGQAKVLDFGLAQTAHSTKLTRMGSTLGTVAYMSPEQARGEEVDGRSDLYSLGTVLYEMIAGKLPFGGEYEQAVVYSILNAEPEPLTALRTGVPMELERITGKLLAKEASRRYQTASGLIADLGGLDFSSTTTETRKTVILQTSSSSEHSGFRSPYVLVAAGSVLGAALLWLVMGSLMGSSDDRLVHRFEMVLPIKEPVTDLAISKDGSSIAFTEAGGPIQIYDFVSGLTRTLEGTDDSAVFEFSEDGESILITTALGVERSSTKIGSSIELFTPNEGTPRANWAPNGVIVYESRNRFMIGDGSNDDIIVSLSDTTGGEDLDWPSVLPDGKTVMGIIERNGGRREIGFWDIRTGEELGALAQGGYRPQYLPSGHIVMVIGSSTEPGSLVAMPFDPKTLKQTGEVIPIDDAVVAERASVSPSGTLVYSRGGVASTFDQRHLLLVSMDGSVDSLGFPPAIYATVRVSPSGRLAVVSVVDGDDTSRQGDALDVSVLNLESKSSITLTSNRTGGTADWYMGSDSVVYVDNSLRAEGIDRVVVRAANGSGQAREIFRSNAGIHEIDASLDGQSIVFTSGRGALGSTQLNVYQVASGESVQLSDGSPARRRRPMLSPDATQVFYQEEGRLFTRSIDGSGVPTTPGGGGLYPVWEPLSGLKFGYGQISRTIWSGLDSDTRSAFGIDGIVRAMDAVPGGERLLVAASSGFDSVRGRGAGADSVQTIQVVLNLAEYLK